MCVLRSVFMFCSLGTGLLAASAATAGNLSAKVGANPDLRLATGTVEAAYREGADILARVDAPNDGSCIGVSFSSASGSNLSDTALLLSINRQADFDSAAARGYKVNFVGAIRVCGSQSNPDFRGCKTGGRIFIRYPIPRLSTTLVHEWGHFKGLSHAPTINANLWRIMYFQDNPQRLGVTPGECGALTGRIDGVADAPETTIAQAPANEAAPNAPAVDIDLDEFLRQGWFYGLPMPEIVALTPEQIGQIREAVDAARSVDIMPNAVTILGLRGERADIDLLVRLMQRLGTMSDPAAQEALLLVPIAIGRLSGRTGAQEGVDFLKSLSLQDTLGDYTSESGVSEQILRENAFVGLAYTNRLQRDSGPVNLNAMRAESNRRNLANMPADDGFFAYVEQLSDDVERMGVLEEVTRANADEVNNR